MGFFVLFVNLFLRPPPPPPPKKKKRKKKKQTQGHFKLSGCLDTSVGTLTIPVLSAFQMQTFVV